MTPAEFDQLKADIEEIMALRVKPTNGFYDDLGEMIFRWATDPTTRPALDPDGTVKNTADFRKQIEPYFQNLPADIKRFVFVQPGPGEYYIRLPAAELAKKSRSIMERLGQLSAQKRQVLDFEYPDPGFYRQRFDAMVGMSDLEYLMNRVGDYTFAHCA